MDDEMRKYVKCFADSIRYRGDDHSRRAEHMARVNTRVVQPLIDFLRICKKTNRIIFETVICGTIEGLLLQETGSVDEALNLLERCRKEIIEIDNIVRKNDKLGDNNGK